jgi:hypothetical protein
MVGRWDFSQVLALCTVASMLGRHVRADLPIGRLAPRVRRRKDGGVGALLRGEDTAPMHVVAAVALARLVITCGGRRRRSAMERGRQSIYERHGAWT